MLPEISGNKLTINPWNAFTYDRVLEYYDGPRLMLQRSGAGQLYLAWWNDADESVDRWLCLPVSKPRLRQILSGSMTSLDALTNPEDGYLLVVDVDTETDSVIQTKMTNPEAIPQDSLPVEDDRLDFPMPEDIIGDIPTRERAHYLDVGLEDGRSERTGRMGADIVGRFVSALQRLFNAIGQAIEEGPTSKGRISNAVLEKTQLDLVGAYAGSFRLLFETNMGDDSHGNSLARSSLERLFDLLEAGDLDSGLTLQQKTLNPRVARNYSDFLSTIETSLSAASIRWSQSGHGNSRELLITEASARSIKSRIKTITSNIQDNLRLEGVIVACNIRTRRFQFEARSSKEQFSGRIHKNVAYGLGHIPVGSSCRVILQPDFQVNETTGEEKTIYTLLYMEPL